MSRGSEILRRFIQASDTRARGRVGEQAARHWLERRGFEILATNYTVKPGEIDVIAREGDCLCFIEIKARATASYGGALAAVPYRKQRRIARAASLYLMSSDWEGPCRFDVLGLERGGDRWEFELVRDAFQVPESG